MRLISKSEFARERKVTPGRVSQWLKDGRIGEGDGGKIDADEAHARLDARLDQAKGMRRAGNVTSHAPEPEPPVEQSAPSSDRLPLTGGAVTGRPELSDGAEKSGDAPENLIGDRPSGQSRDDTSYWAHKAKREEYEALLAQAKYFREAGALTLAAAVRKEAMDTARALRNALEAIPDRIAPVLDPASPSRAHKLLLDEIRKALHEFSDRLGERAAVAGSGGSVTAILQRVC